MEILTRQQQATAIDHMYVSNYLLKGGLKRWLLTSYTVIVGYFLNQLK